MLLGRIAPVLFLFLLPAGWESKAPMPAGNPFPGQPAATVGSRIYVIADRFGTLYEYDTTADTWSDRKAPVPTRRHHYAVVAVNGRIYTIGGCTGGSENEKHEPVAVVEEYDPQSNTWRARAPLPEPRRNASAAVLNGRIYLFGGENLDRKGLPVAVYNPASDSWARKNAVPAPSYFAAAHAVKGRIYIIGSGGTGPVTQEYNPENDSFVDRAPFPTPRGAFGSVAAGDWVYLAGGMGDGNAPQATVERYNPATDKWEKLPDLPIAKRYPGVAAANGRVYVLGGVATTWDKPEKAVDMFDPSALRPSVP